ncbi:MAG: DUF7450 family protein [Planctomycetota bacterium]|jgi:hypothetical protein
MKKSMLLAVLMTAALIFAWAASGLAQERPQPLKLDHFKVYRLKPQEIGPVLLKGQFDPKPRKVVVGPLTHFANPASKNGAGIFDKNAHLAWYRIQQEKEPERVVLVRNQFGEQKLTLGQPRFLLAPAKKGKEGGEFPKRLDHYKCYEVIKGEPAQKVVSLEDQFGAERQAKVGRPRLLGVPVEKTYHGKTFEIQNKEAHLLVYDISRKEHPREIEVADQFGERTLVVSFSEFLCVPSIKKPVQLEPKGD